MHIPKAQNADTTQKQIPPVTSLSTLDVSTEMFKITATNPERAMPLSASNNYSIFNSIKALNWLINPT